jgi:uncharacterized protein YkwD
MKRILIFATLLLLLAGCRPQPADISLIDRVPEVGREQIMFEHNRQRALQNLEPLVEDPLLTQASQDWADWMAAARNLVHSRLTVRDPYHTIGENIAMGFDSIDTVMVGWMQSVGHRRNILNPRFTHAGFGLTRDRDGTPYWCAQFAGK